MHHSWLGVALAILVIVGGLLFGLARSNDAPQRRALALSFCTLACVVIAFFVCVVAFGLSWMRPLFSVASFVVPLAVCSLLLLVGEGRSASEASSKGTRGARPAASRRPPVQRPLAAAAADRAASPGALRNQASSAAAAGRPPSARPAAASAIDGPGLADLRPLEDLTPPAAVKPATVERKIDYASLPSSERSRAEASVSQPASESASRPTPSPEHTPMQPATATGPSAPLPMGAPLDKQPVETPTPSETSTGEPVAPPSPLPTTNDQPRAALAFDPLFAKARTLRDKGAYGVAARLFDEAAACGDETERRRARFEQLACCVKADRSAEARALVEELRADAVFLTSAQRVKLEAAARMLP